MFPSYLEVDKTGSQLFRAMTNTVAAIWREKKVDSLLFGDQKMQFTTVRSKEKDYDIYLKSEKLVRRQLGARKKCFPDIWKWKKLVPSYFDPNNTLSQLFKERKKWIPAIWRLKNVVHNCQEQGKRL